MSRLRGETVWNKYDGGYTGLPRREGVSRERDETYTST